MWNCLINPLFSWVLSPILFISCLLPLGYRYERKTAYFLRLKYGAELWFNIKKKGAIPVGRGPWGRPFLWTGVSAQKDQAAWFGPHIDHAAFSVFEIVARVRILAPKLTLMMTASGNDNNIDDDDDDGCVVVADDGRVSGNRSWRKKSQ